MAWSPGGIIASTAGEVAGRVVTPMADAWARTRESAAEVHKIDATTNRDMTVSSFQTDQRFGELQVLLANADRTDPRTAWIRPVGAGISLWVFACVALEHTMPKLAALLWISTSELPMPWAYICGGILIAIFGLRPFEKNWRAKTVTNAHSSIVTAQVQARSRPALRPFKREDDA